jgi:excisionase family DNA binding protein
MSPGEYFRRIFRLLPKCHLQSRLLQVKTLTHNYYSLLSFKQLWDCRILTPPGHAYCYQIDETRIKWGEPMSLIERDPVLTTDEAIEYLKISKPTFLKYIRVGRIRATKAGKGWRILQSELYRFLNGKEEFGDVK